MACLLGYTVWFIYRYVRNRMRARAVSQRVTVEQDPAGWIEMRSLGTALDPIIEEDEDDNSFESISLSSNNQDTRDWSNEGPKVMQTFL